MVARYVALYAKPDGSLLLPPCFAPRVSASLHLSSLGCENRPKRVDRERNKQDARDRRDTKVLNQAQDCTKGVRPLTSNLSVLDLSLGLQ